MVSMPKVLKCLPWTKKRFIKLWYTLRKKMVIGIKYISKEEKISDLLIQPHELFLNNVVLKGGIMLTIILVIYFTFFLIDLKTLYWKIPPIIILI